MHLGTRSLTLTVDGVARTAEVSDCRIVSAQMPEELKAIAGPTRQYRLQGTAVQDPADGSMWDLLWTLLDQEVAVDIRPAGGATPSLTQPAFTGNVTVAEVDGDLLGGPANPSPTRRFSFNFDWPFTDKPTRLTEPGDSP